MMPGPPIFELHVRALRVLDRDMRCSTIVFLVHTYVIAIEAVKIQFDRFVDLREVFNQNSGGDPLSHAQ